MSRREMSFDKAEAKKKKLMAFKDEDDYMECLWAAIIDLSEGKKPNPSVIAKAKKMLK